MFGRLEVLKGLDVFEGLEVVEGLEVCFRGA